MPAAHYLVKDASSATACGTGTWNPSHERAYGSSSGCNNCPSGYDDGAAASTESGCIISVSGGKYVGTAKSSTLSNCDGGTYKASHTVEYGSTSLCPSCGAGKWSAAGSSSCSNIDAGCYGTSASTACPAECAAGTYSTGGASSCTPCTGLPSNAEWTGSATSNDCPWECNDGYNLTSDNQCAQYCAAGVTHIHLGTGLKIPLYSAKRTTPSINVRHNGAICYADLIEGESTGLHVKYNGKTYHAAE